MPRLGAHLSAAGGVQNAAEAAVLLGCRALQIFLRPPGRWAAGPLPDELAARFREAAEDGGLTGACFAHAPYLLNLASADDGLRQRSVGTLVEELRRAGELSLAGVVLHPGSAGSGDRGEAERRCLEAVEEAVARAGEGAATLILEGTAGAGGQLGRSPAELAGLVPAAAEGVISVCLDTAHLWGAGYDLLGEGWENVLAEVRDHFGLRRLPLIHINDTAVACGSHRDRHAPPGEGALGEAFFRRLLRDERVTHAAMILEIPPGKDNQLVGQALERLRGWLPGQ